MTSDHEAVRRVLRGDSAAYGELVERYQGPLAGFVGNLLPPHEDREGVLQDVFLSAFARLHTYRSERGGFSTWLFTIARNRCLNVLKARRPETRAEVPETTHHVTPDVDAQRAEVFRRLDAGLAALPLEQRSAFVLFELQGCSYADVARIEGVGLGTVKSRIARAREKLRAHLPHPSETP